MVRRITSFSNLLLVCHARFSNVQYLYRRFCRATAKYTTCQSPLRLYAHNCNMLLANTSRSPVSLRLLSGFMGSAVCGYQYLHLDVQCSPLSCSYCIYQAFTHSVHSSTAYPFSNIPRLPLTLLLQESYFGIRSGTEALATEEVKNVEVGRSRWPFLLAIVRF